MTGNDKPHDDVCQVSKTIPTFTRTLSAVPKRGASRTWDEVLNRMIVPRLESCQAAANRLTPQLSKLTRWATTLIVHHIDAVVYEDSFVCVRINLGYEGGSAPDQLDSQFLAAIEPLEPDSQIRITFLCKYVDLLETFTIPALDDGNITVELRSMPGPEQGVGQEPDVGQEQDEMSRLPFEKDPAEPLVIHDAPRTIADLIDDVSVLDSLGNQEEESTQNEESIHHE